MENERIHKVSAMPLKAKKRGTSARKPYEGCGFCYFMGGSISYLTFLSVFRLYSINDIFLHDNIGVTAQRHQ